MLHLYPAYIRRADELIQNQGWYYEQFMKQEIKDSLEEEGE